MKINEDGNRKMLRQGDLLFFKIDKWSESSRQGKLRPSRDNIIARGEATGHNHVLETEEGVEASLFFADANVPGAVIRVTSGIAKVTHDEHETQELDEGDWLVVRQSEYTPSAQQWRTVAD